MKINDRYITKTLLSFTFVVLIVWLGIYSFFNFLAEVNKIGEETYSSLDAMIYTFLKIPEVIYSHATAVILLGCVLGMGHLATTNQLVVMRVSGMSINKLTLITIRIALMFVFVFIFIGEVISPYTSEEALKIRSKELGISIAAQNQEGFWIRDGSSIINVKKNFDGRLFSDVTIYEINDLNRINSLTKSKNATFDKESLNFDQASIYYIDNSKLFGAISIEELGEFKKNVSFDSDLIESLKKHPEDLTTWQIFKQVQFLSENKLRSSLYEVEIYKRLIKPLTLIAMILLAMLFIFGASRDASLGKKIFFGIIIGLLFELLSRISGALSLGFNFSPLISAVLPTMIVMIIAMTLLVYKSSN